VIGALLLGVAEQVFGLYVHGGLDVVAGLLLLLLILGVRPSGIFGTTRGRVV
jgi:branched-subunit amino acid ABC-type transport system permease component